MRNPLTFAGFLLVVVGVSGALDHVAAQPLMGLVLNALNRHVIEPAPVFDGYELYANLGVAGLGALMLLASRRARE
ncbi:hypothetical protein [Sinosporangium album]|nr:hypothetical protein [Sinosporangium album]